MSFSRGIFAIVGLAALAFASWDVQPARCDVFVLTHGGRVSGQWLNRGKLPLERYEIALDSGGLLSLEASQVQRAIAQDPATREYERVAAASAPTVEGQWAVAEWCRKRDLSEQRRLHLQRVLELDPDHAGARHALGYSQVRGAWVLRRDYLEARGYQRSDGRWRLPQQIQLSEEQAGVQQAERNWYLQLRRWRSAMGTEHAAEAYRGLASVNDPAAVPALSRLLREERYRQVKLLYIEALGRIPDASAAGALVDTSLSDPDDEVFFTCMDVLAASRPPHVTRRYLAALKDNNNIKLNRGAYALGTLGDFSCISPLIDALITTHYMVIPGRSDVQTATFSQPADGGSSPWGGMGLSAGDQTLVLPWTVHNEQVLQALIQLSGGSNFGFERRAWSFWLANENRKQAAALPTRRDAP